MGMFIFMNAVRRRRAMQSTGTRKPVRFMSKVRGVLCKFALLGLICIISAGLLRFS